MKYGCSNSNNVQEIEEIYIDGCNNPGYFKKSVLYDYLKKNPRSIKVYISPYPDVLPAQSSYRLKMAQKVFLTSDNQGILHVSASFRNRGMR